MIKEWHEEIDSSWHDKGLSDLEILLKGLCESRTNFVGCFGHPPGLREATRRLEVVSCLFYSIIMLQQNSIDTLTPYMYVQQSIILGCENDKYRVSQKKRSFVF
jgi:hypothetical protein